MILFDSLNRTEFVEKPGYMSVIDAHGTIKSILRHGPLWGEEILGGGGGPHVSAVGDLCDDPVVDIVQVAVDAVGDCRHDPVVDICEVAVDATPVDATPIVSVIGDKRKLPAEHSGKPAPDVQFFNPRSSTAKKVQLDCLEMQLKTAEIRMKELEKYIEEGKEDLKVVSNASFAGEQGFSAEECVGLIQGLKSSSKEERKKVRYMLSSIETNIKG